jgi:hypothetical protein
MAMTKSPCHRVCKVRSAHLTFFLLVKLIIWYTLVLNKTPINSVLDHCSLFMHALQLMEVEGLGDDVVCVISETLIKRQVTRNDCLPRLLCDGDKHGLINYTDIIVFVSFSKKFWPAGKFSGIKLTSCRRILPAHCFLAVVSKCRLW